MALPFTSPPPLNGQPLREELCFCGFPKEYLLFGGHGLNVYICILKKKILSDGGGELDPPPLSYLKKSIQRQHV